MNAIQELEQQVKGIFPEATTRIDEGEEETSPWWLDITLEHKRLTVEWRPGRGFGVTLVTAETAYGEGPEHVVQTVDEAIECLLMLAEQKVAA